VVLKFGVLEGQVIQRNSHGPDSRGPDAPKPAGRGAAKARNGEGLSPPENNVTSASGDRSDGISPFRDGDDLIHFHIIELLLGA